MAGAHHFGGYRGMDRGTVDRTPPRDDDAANIGTANVLCQQGKLVRQSYCQDEDLWKRPSA
eukprot:scaffold160_cov139-Amphora_coffeaeformis.AAC.2